jgi:ClpP class serine protease
VKTTLPLELLRSTWLIREDALETYRPIVQAYLTAMLAGKEISLDMFSKIAMPTVPDNVALIVMNGMLTKADVCGNKGTRTLTGELLAAAHNPQYDSILLYAESCPGGQVDGTKTMADAVNMAKGMKPVVGAFSGVSASGGIWIQSQCTEFYATSETDLAGCIGVMATIKNPKNVTEGQDIIEVYSNLSPDKNGEFRNVDTYKANLLDPVAKLFQKDVMAGRGDKLKEDILTGATRIAADAKKFGLIDGVMPINKIVARSLFLARTSKNKK